MSQAIAEMEKPMRYTDGITRVGDLVHYFPGGDVHSEPHIAVVTKLGVHSINVSCFHPDYQTVKPHDGVKHVNDPHVKDQERQECGLWTEAPQTVLLKSLESAAATIEQLSRKMNQLEGAMEGVIGGLKSEVATLKGEVTKLKKRE